RAVRSRRGVRVKRLQRVHEHAGDVAARPENAEAVLAHLLEGVDVPNRTRIADAGLHAIPPTVVRTAETNKVRASGVIAGQAYRLHHGLGTRHVKGHFVETGNRLEPADIVFDNRMVQTQYRTEILHPVDRRLEAPLIEVVAK